MPSQDVIPSRVFMVLVKNRLSKKPFKGDRVLHSCATVVTLPGKNTTYIVSLGSHAMTVIFGGNRTTSLAALR